MQIATILFCLFQMGTNPQDASKMVEIEFVGAYNTGRAPCEWLPDGSRRWAITTGFTIKTVEKGNLKVDYIEIAPGWSENNEVQLLEGAVYSVKMALSLERFKALELGNKETIMIYQDPILEKEIKNIEKQRE